MTRAHRVFSQAWSALLILCIVEAASAYMLHPQVGHRLFRGPPFGGRPSVTSRLGSRLYPPPSCVQNPSSRGLRLSAQATSNAVRPSELADNKKNLRAFFPSAKRIVALGDVHGGTKNMLRCLRAAEVVDENGDWCGGEAVLVQVGDILDRGIDEAGCVETLLRLRKQSRLDGGNVIMLLGNHEILNAEQDFRYAKSGQFSNWKVEGGFMAQLSYFFSGKRHGLFKRGSGAMALVLASCPVIVQIGDTVFCHGGLTPASIRHGFQRLNDDTSAWLQGQSEHKPASLEPVGSETMEISPLWERAYGTRKIAPPDMQRLDLMLDAVGATKMVVGHTPQEAGVNGVESRHGNQVWRVDVGLGERRGRIECLELVQCEDGTTDCMWVLGESGCEDARMRLTPNWNWRKSRSEAASVLDSQLESCCQV
mmetsp:Transcript_32311/g.76172  ORF Transcript_32311/g.76172 Transcript_32311/m.76172 type:complete len:423 (+) Transcript_32311:226-1494(+)